jgi:FMN phosphatase YigB (HAD superfamily)
MQPEATQQVKADTDSANPGQQLAERRKRNIPVAIDRRRANAAEKRRTSERRRLIDPTTCERDYTDEETLFMKAMERYKRENRRPFPTWSEVLEVMRSLGYRKVAEETDLPGVKKDAAGVVAPPKG